MQLRPLQCLPVDCELLAQGKILKGKVAVAAAEDWEESQYEEAKKWQI